MYPKFLLLFIFFKRHSFYYGKVLSISFSHIFSVALGISIEDFSIPSNHFRIASSTSQISVWKKLLLVANSSFSKK